MAFILTKEELELLDEIYKSKQILRKFLGSKEIKIANNLVKLRLLTKGFQMANKILFVTT